MDALRFSKRQSQGEARDSSTETASLSGMVSTFVPVVITATVLFTIFLILRRSKRRFYAPRTYLGSLREQERTPALPNGLFNWIGAFWKIPDIVALQSQSLDAYLFLRFLRICATICLVGLLMTWPVLFPVNATGGGGQKELNILSMSNIDISKSSNKTRLYAHAFIGAPLSTVLLCKLRIVFSDSVKNLWIAGTTKDLDELVEERDKVAMKLEGAEVKLIKAVNKERLKAIKNGASAEKPAPSNDAEPGQVAARWIPQKSRPTHRLGKFGLYGKKVDSIDWARAELQRLIPQVDAAQAEYRAGNYAKNGAVFVEFYTQSDAQAAFQVLTHHHALHMSPRYIGITPGEVIWKSLSIPWWQKVVRKYAVTAFITVLILFWAIPVAGVAMISQVDTLKKVSFLTWLDKIPNIILGLVGGLLPSVAMAILMALVPIIMRLCAKIAGEPSASRVELFTQNAYFCFQLIQVFLITTISSSAVAAAQQIVDDPSSVFDILSEALPRSSQFYVSYFIVQGLGIAASVVSQVVGFIIFTLIYRFLTSTPRSMYNKWAQLSAISWGSVMPVYTNIAVISIAYAVIAPIMLFWSTIGIGCFYMAYRYNILFVTDTNIDTRGLIYPRALKQLTCGVYLAEICMIGMFSVKKAPGPVVIAVVLLVLTILGHITFASALNPLLYSLPRTLQVEEELLLTGDVEAAAAGTNGEGAAGTQSKAAIFKKVLPGNGDNVVEKRGNIITRWLKPWIFADYHTLRALVPHDLVDVDQLYSEQVEKDAYFPPSVTSATPLLWIPEDKAGVSRDEIIQTSKVIGITDEGCTLDDKNKLQWDAEGARPPIWDEKIYY
ncbi:phosphate metabolism protein [Verticillium alfalfae VaMs.102]|uniref:Phosphate metabolism protein n=1 Tax=Verticillium alfalfae (strain VaMs.102 / ATCC MYA-4576 / FGSC 10136) TaxID=526221 RepID=C9S8C4_VERA1|nr:phosphate metabolism protein [Verticillium alfalfae VaMs.102]EEY14903.1 phosphate metabolism protein [Verticillium alfalfae VaMs.102]